MMTLRGFVLILSTVLLYHLSLSADAAASAGARPGAFRYLVGYCVVACCLGKLIAVLAALRHPSTSIGSAWRWFEMRRSQLEWLWAGALPWAFTFGGVGDLLSATAADGWPQALLLAAWFAPSLLFLLSLDLCAGQLEHDLLSSDNRAHLKSTGWINRIRLGSTGGVIMCIVPVLLTTALIEIVEANLPSLSLEARLAISAAVLACVCCGVSPLWMRLWVGADRVAAGEQLSLRLVELSKQLRLPAPTLIRVSNPAWRGAALVGWFSYGRQLWIGSGVVEDLSEPEQDMVLLHELAHLKRGHCWWRLAPAVLCGGFAAFAASSTSAPEGISMQTALPIAFACAAVVSMTWISRRCEVDADAQACIFAAGVCAWAAERPTCASTVLGHALRRLQGEAVADDQWHWLHPSMSKRMLFLTRRFSTVLDSQQSSPVVAE